MGAQHEQNQYPRIAAGFWQGDATLVLYRVESRARLSPSQTTLACQDCSLAQRPTCSVRDQIESDQHLLSTACHLFTLHRSHKPSGCSHLETLPSDHPQGHGESQYFWG